jgi:hypothetical protein
MLRKIELSETILEIAASQANCKNNQTKKAACFCATVQRKAERKRGKRKGGIPQRRNQAKTKAWPRKQGENIQSKNEASNPDLLR